MTPPTPAEIAERLSVAQRRDLLDRAGSNRTFTAFRRLGLMVGGEFEIRVGRKGVGYIDPPELTPLGLAVRAAIQPPATEPGV